MHLSLLILLLLILCITQSRLFTNITRNIVCPSDEECRVICVADQCSNIDIYCQDNDHGCYIHCNTTACANSRFYFLNAVKSEILCHSESCRDSEIYLEPKNNNSTVFIDMESSVSMDKIHINYQGNKPFTNNQIIDVSHSNVSIPIYQITILCSQNNSCKQTSFQISSLQYFELYCLADNSCSDIDIDFISYNNNNRGALTIICNGTESCLNANINAITANKLEMFCQPDTNSCSTVLIQCPINSDVALTEHSCIMECSNSDSCLNGIIYSMYGMIQLNNPNINALNANNLQMYCGYGLNKTCIVGMDCTAICAPPSQDNNMQMVLPFNNNMQQLNCDGFHELCIVFMNLNIAQSVQCNHSIQCTVICMGINCGSNTIIYATHSNVLILQSSMDFYFTTTEIYGPVDGDFISNAALIDVTLYLAESSTIDITCSMEHTCDGISIYANNTNQLTIECKDIASCKSISTYIGNISSTDAAYCKMNWNCYTDGCQQHTNKLFTTDNKLQCIINTADGVTHCNEYILSAACDNTLEFTSTTTNVVLQSQTNNKQSTFWTQLGGVLALCILATCSCLCCGTLIIAKNKINKKLSHQQANETNVNNTEKRKNTITHSREDTIGSTVEDIIKDSTAVQFRNPLEMHMVMGYNNRISISPSPYGTRRNTASISATPVMHMHNKPYYNNINTRVRTVSDDYKDDEKAVEIVLNNSNNYLHSHSRHHTMEGSMDMDARMYSMEDNGIELQLAEQSPNLTSRNNTNTTITTSNGSSLNIVNESGNTSRHKATFSNPSLVVLSLYDNESSESSHGLYGPGHGDEGGKVTTTDGYNNNRQTNQMQYVE